jgi:hypothetical protein
MICPVRAAINGFRNGVIRRIAPAIRQNARSILIRSGPGSKEPPFEMCARHAKRW